MYVEKSKESTHKVLRELGSKVTKFNHTVNI